MGEDISGWPGADPKGSYGESIMKPELSVSNDSIQILRLPQVCIVTGLRRSMIYQLEAQQAFPRRIKIGIRAVGWIESEVQAWVAQRVEASRRHLKRAT
jgi:prophage regulatory protein